MSGKLTTEELTFLKQAAVREQNLIASELFGHIAAVESERDALAALVNEWIDQGNIWSDYEGGRNGNMECLICHEFWYPGATDKHAPDCLISRARQALAAMDNEDTTNS